MCRLTRSFLALVAALLALAAPREADAGPQDVWPNTAWMRRAPGSPPPLGGYRLVFDDEFDRLDVGCYHWGKPVGPRHWYTMDGDRVGVASTPCPGGPDSPVSVAGGVLAITASYRNGAWRSGNLEAVNPSGEGFRISRGYFEARIRLPRQVPQGLVAWPAFWIQGRYTFPGTGYSYTELDILESWSRPRADVNVVSLHQWPGRPPQHEVIAHRVRSLRTRQAAFDGAWHVYGALVADDRICAYLDNRELACFPAAGADLRAPLYPIVDLAVQSAATEARGTSYTMFVDYVRVYAPPAGSRR
jgi:hypothetical protein